MPHEDEADIKSSDERRIRRGNILLFRQAVDEAVVTREPGAPAVTRLTGCRTAEAVGGPVKDPSPS
jgi:hypothetical protein